jgi:hypothetical protein
MTGGYQQAGRCWLGWAHGRSALSCSAVLLSCQVVRMYTVSADMHAHDLKACVFEGLRIFLRILCKLGMCVIVANTMERCSLFLPPRWGAGPMTLMLWLNVVF